MAYKTQKCPIEGMVNPTLRYNRIQIQTKSSLPYLLRYQIEITP